MPKFKVINPDTPEEIDLVQDIPLVDEETGLDQIDSEGNILVKRYVTRTVNLNGINAVKDSLPQIKENAKNLKDLYDYSHSVNTDQQNQILENSSKITELLTDTTALEVTVTELENKIKGIQGIDIDEVKADLDALKQSAYLITGGTLKGDISVQTPHTATVTLNPSGSSSSASFSCTNDMLECTSTWGKLFKQSEEGGFFYGLSSTALADKNGKELTNYISDIMGSNAQLTFIKGDGTSQVISINNVISATKATNADNATNLGGYPATDYIRSVNGINADENGNIQLDNIVKSVNSVTPDEQGNVQLNGLVKSVNGVNADASGNVTIQVKTGLNIDYSAGISKPTPYYGWTADKDGYAFITIRQYNSGSSSRPVIYVNNIAVLTYSSSLSVNTAFPDCVAFPVNKGDRITYKVAVDMCLFFPFK